MGADETAGEPPRAAEQRTSGADEPSSATGEAGDAHHDATGGAERPEGFDLKGIVRQLTAPMIESLDTRLRDQIEAHVDELLTERIEAAVADRLSTVDRAIADLSRTLDALERRLAALERGDDAG